MTNSDYVVPGERTPAIGGGWYVPWLPFDVNGETAIAEQDADNGQK